MGQPVVSNKQAFETMAQQVNAILAMLDHRQLGRQDVLEDQLEELSKFINQSSTI